MMTPRRPAVPSSLLWCCAVCVSAAGACKPKDAPATGDATAASSATTTVAPTAPAGDVPHVPEEVRFGELPGWPAPPPRFDGGPVTLRAARMNGRVGVWGHGTLPGAKGLYMKVRLYDGNVIVHETSIGGAHAQQEGSWYPVTSNVAHGAEKLTFDAVAAQVYYVQGDGTDKLWEPPPGLGGAFEWGYPLPEKPTHDVAGSPVGFAVLAIETERAKLDGKLETRFVLGVHNRGDVALESVDFGVKLEDDEGTIAAMQRTYRPSGEEKPLPPKRWARMELTPDGDATRLQKARLAFTVEKTKPAP